MGGEPTRAPGPGLAKSADASVRRRSGRAARAATTGVELSESRAANKTCPTESDRAAQPKAELPKEEKTEETIEQVD